MEEYNRTFNENTLTEELPAAVSSGEVHVPPRISVMVSGFFALLAFTMLFFVCVTGRGGSVVFLPVLAALIAAAVSAAGILRYCNAAGELLTGNFCFRTLAVILACVVIGLPKVLTGAGVETPALYSAAWYRIFSSIISLAGIAAAAALLIYSLRGILSERTPRERTKRVKKTAPKPQAARRITPESAQAGAARRDVVEPGDIVLGSWQVRREIGHGSFGKVYEIVREEFGRTYRAALKVISIPQDNDEIRRMENTGSDRETISMYYRSVLDDIINENDIMTQLKGNTNIVSYEDHQVLPHGDGIGYDILIRMELLMPLLEYMRGRALTRHEVVRLGIDICRALELCHRKKIVHRDIKPQNIFVSDNGDFKLGDFGIARTMEKTMGEASRKGTVKYMAPEVYRGDRYDDRVDIYSLGIVMYYLLNGNRGPFLPAAPAVVTYNIENEASMRRIRGERFAPPAGADAQLAEVIMKACAYIPDRRYRTAEEMRAALESIIA